MAAAPVQFQVHTLVGMLLFAIWPFTRLVHAFTAPLHYLFRPYIVYRSRDAAHVRRRGRRARAGARSARRDRDRSSPRRRHERQWRTAAPSCRARPRTSPWPRWPFAISFWAWNLIAPLGVRYTDELGPHASQKSLLVAMPVLVGVARPDPRRRADRPLRRPADVHACCCSRPRRSCCWSRSPATRTPTRCCSCSGSSSASPARRSRSASRSSTRGTSRPARVRHRRLRRRHGRHRAVGVLHPAVRRLVRLHARPT